MKFIVYVAVLLIAAAGLAFGLDLLTAPPKKLEANAAKPASAAVRQIPIKEATAEQNGDPNNQLSPIYPAAPGKDLPVKDAPVQAAAKEAPKPATQTAPLATPQTSGRAPAAPVSGSTATIASAGACNFDACTAAYRSFRASDCSYQPFDGERKICDAGQGAQAAATVPSTQTSIPPARQEPSAQVQNNQKTRDQRDLEAATRTVRSLPPQESRESARDDGRDVVVEEPLYGERDSPRRRWIVEQR